MSRRRTGCGWPGGTASHAWPAALPSRSLEIGGQLGFVGVTLDTSALLMRYALEMGVEPGFFATLIGQPPEASTWIETSGQFIALGISPLGPLPPPGSLAEQAANLCNHATGWQVGVRHSHARPVAAAAARPTLAAEGKATTQAAFAGLMLRGAATPTSTAHFDISGPASDTFRIRCQVTLSTVDLDAFEVTLATSGALLRRYALPPAVSPGLLRYHRDDRLNPRR